jgi:hypothetical protein
VAPQIWRWWSLSDDNAVTGQRCAYTLGSCQDLRRCLLNVRRPVLPDRLDHQVCRGPIFRPPSCRGQCPGQARWRSDANFAGRGDIDAAEPELRQVIPHGPSRDAAAARGLSPASFAATLPHTITSQRLITAVMDDDE